MPVNLPTNLLRSFVAIVESGSMLNAAEQVFVTQSALSLEDLLGKFIFNVADLSSNVAKSLEQKKEAPK